MGRIKKFMGLRKTIKETKKLLKDSGYSRPKDFDYKTTNHSITITFKEKKVKERVLKSLDSSIEWGLRQTNTR